MGKIILEFDSYEDRAEAYRAVTADKAYLVLWDMDQALRQIAKYSDDEVAANAAESWREKLRDLCIERSVDIDGGD